MSSLPVGPTTELTDPRDDVRRVRLLGADTISLDWGATTELLPCRDVVSAHSMGNHTLIVAHGRTLKVHCPLKAIIAVLGPVGLAQVRRDVAVNAARVRRLVGGGRHRLVIELEGGVRVSVGRQFQSDIRARFGSTLRSGT